MTAQPTNQNTMTTPIEPTSMLRPSIQVLERTNDLLNTLARHNQAMSLKILAEQTGLHVSTAHRILNDLVLARIVDRPSSGHYQLGMRLLELGNLVKERLNVRDVALPIMKALHQQTRQTINLSVRQNDEIIYVERAYSERSGMQVVRAIGGRAPVQHRLAGADFRALRLGEADMGEDRLLRGDEAAIRLPEPEMPRRQLEGRKAPGDNPG